MSGEREKHSSSRREPSPRVGASASGASGASGAPGAIDTTGPLPPRPHRRRFRLAEAAGSELACRQAAVILEVLAGLRGTTDASAALGVSPPRYYQLEARAVTGLVRGLEPRPKGAQPAPEAVIARLQRDNARLARELARAQALVRVAQRAIGVKETGPGPGRANGRSAPPRSRRRSDRAGRAIAALRSARPAPDTSPSPGALPPPESP